jgi:hypothetical protein
LTARAHRLIGAAGVLDNLLPTGNIPETERQARELAPIDAEAQKAVWQIALKTAPARRVDAKLRFVDRSTNHHARAHVVDHRKNPTKASMTRCDHAPVTDGTDGTDKE